MRRKVTYWFVLILSAMFMVSCSDDDKQDGGETGKALLVGVWHGTLGYDCSSGNHDLIAGTIIFDSDATGVLKDMDENAESFHYEVDEESMEVLINFDDNRQGVFHYFELSKNRLTFVEVCSNCGKKVNMQLERVN